MKLFKVGVLMAIFMAMVFFVGISSVSAADEVELSGKDLKAKTVSEVAALYNISPTEYADRIGKTIKVKVNTSDTFQLLHDNYGAEPSAVKDIAVLMQSESGQAVTAKDLTTESATSAKAPEKQYNFFPISIGLLIAYILSFVLSRYKVISYSLHKKIWNWFLLGFFLVSAILGSFLVLRISNNIVIPLPFNMLYWHVEAGVALTAISIFHIVWHWRYFVTLFKKKI